MSKVKVSIIIPVYGVEKYIGKCLESLVNQTLKDIEIIVVNDGSLDNSQDIIDEYVKKYPNIVKSYIKENGGQGSARNYGIEKSTGEYIGYVDSDDYVEQDMYEKLYTKAKEEKSDVVICGNYLIDEDYQNRKIDFDYSDNLEDTLKSFFGKKAVWNKIYKREIIIENKIKFAEKKWYEDFAFTLKILVNSDKISFVDEPLYYYLIRQGSTMNNSNVKRNLEILEAFEDITTYLKKNKMYEKYYDKLEYLAIDHIYISTIVRIINADADKQIKKETIKTILEYLNDNFPVFKQNKYLKILPRNRKIVYRLLIFKQYNLIKLLFKIKNGA